MSESFEDAMTIFRENLAGMYDNGHMTKWADVDTSVDLDCLQDAHDHELEQTRKSEYHRGYEDGRRSMDAEHYAVALRLRALPLDGGTQENLSQIARAVWHSDFGWTEGACKALRDELVRLLGGVSERPYTTSIYDALGNERHEAVCELRKMRSCKEDHFEPELFFDGLYDALGCRAETDGDSGDQMCDRLIHLLGGDDGTCPNDDPMLSITSELRKYAKTQAYPHNDRLRAIADRIDEQFGRICMQQETVLQSTIADLTAERDGLQAKLDEAEFAIANWREREKSFDTSERLREELRRERDELRRSLRQIAERAGVPHDRDLSEYGDGQIANAVIGQLGETKQYVKSLEWVRDRRLPRIEAERDDLQERLDRVADALRERLDRVADALRGVERGTMSAWEAADEVGR